MVETLVSQNNCKTGGKTMTAIASAATLDTTNGNKIAVGPYQRILMLIHISAASASDSIKIAAGDNPPAFRGDMGDYTYAAEGGAAELFMMVETGRFAQKDGYIHITTPVHATLAGTLEAYGI